MLLSHKEGGVSLRTFPLTDDVWGLHVVGELVLIIVVGKLVDRALVARLQDLLQDLQPPQVAAQTTDPQCLLVSQDGTTKVSFAWGGRGGERQGGKKERERRREGQTENKTEMESRGREK